MTNECNTKTYSVSDIAKLCNLTAANVAWRLNKLGLKSPHGESHLEAVKNYLVKDKKQTLWQMAKQRYGDDASKYQNCSYRWRVLGKPDVKSLDELDELWNKRVEERRKHTEEYKEYITHVNPAASFMRKSQKLRHMYDWLSYDSKGVFDDDVKYWYQWYLDSGYKSCQARRFAYLEVLKQHHVIDQDEYSDFKTDETRLKMAFL